jgi:hypothetical protein
MRRHVCPALLCIVAGSCARLSQAKDAAVVDLSTKIGATSGQIKEPGDGKRDPDRVFSYGGAIISFALNHDVSKRLTGMVQYQLVADLVNSQVSRQGVDAGIAYHLLGGAMRLNETHDNATIAMSQPYNLSFLARTGWRNYGASAKQDPSNKVSGSLLEILAGLEYRWSPSESLQAFGFEALDTVFGLPASVERLQTKGLEASLFWRFLW